MDISTSLSVLAADFSNWRELKTQINTPVPDTLRQRAISFLDYHQAGQVTTALGITTLQLSQWRLVRQLDARASFIELTPQASSPLPSANLELCFVTGEQMKLHGVDEQMLLSIIGALKS